MQTWLSEQPYRRLGVSLQWTSIPSSGEEGCSNQTPWHLCLKGFTFLCLRLHLSWVWFFIAKPRNLTLCLLNEIKNIIAETNIPGHAQSRRQSHSPFFLVKARICFTSCKILPSNCFGWKSRDLISGLRGIFVRTLYHESLTLVATPRLQPPFSHTFKRGKANIMWCGQKRGEKMHQYI